MPDLWLDIETYSEADLKKVGTHAYAAHPSTEITVVSYAVNDGPVTVLDLTAGALVTDLWYWLCNADTLLWAHNSAFDRTVMNHVWDFDPHITRWRDTMVQAMAHGLPGGLDKVGTALGIAADQAKDKRGRDLIQLFCKPRPKNQKLRRATHDTHPEEWEEFLEYAAQDIVAMRAISKKLPRWNYPDNRRELALWHLDQIINDRGVQIDVDFASAAIDAVKVEQARLKSETVDATAGLVAGPSKRDQMLQYILAEHGVDLPDMKADTLRRRMEDPELPEAVRLLISLRLESTKTSTAKYNAMVNATSADGRLRNTLQFCGAQRTGRWAGRLVQLHNMPRPSKGFGAEEQEIGIEAIRTGVADLLYDDVMKLTSNAVRGAIVAPPGKKLVVSDLANIEGRMLAWLAGEDWKLEAFRLFDQGKGPDLYRAAYARSFGVGHATVDDSQRQVGKVQELGLGYEGGVAAFLTFAAVYNMDLDVMSVAVLEHAEADRIRDARSVWQWAKKSRRTLGLDETVYVACEVLKRAWRDAHPEVEGFWKEADEAVRLAIASPGVNIPVGHAIKVRRDGAWLRVRLQSGRYLCYLAPKIDDDGRKGTITYWGVNQYTRRWARLKTYGGKLVENWTQAAARDILAEGMAAAEMYEYTPVLTVHDEVITETPDLPAYTAEDLSSMLADPPAWAVGLPLAAKGFECYRYRKD